MVPCGSEPFSRVYPLFQSFSKVEDESMDRIAGMRSSPHATRDDVGCLVILPATHIICCCKKERTPSTINISPLRKQTSLSITLMTKKKKDSAGLPSRRSLRLIEQARQEMLRQRKLAHGGHEVGDTSEDPLPIPSDEEKEVTPPPPPEGKIGSPSNPDYDSDYAEFLAEFLADDSLGDTPPASPTTPDTTFPASEVDRLSPPSQTPSMVSADSPAVSS
nr:uncharacterized protein LOC109166971 [Ipomoea batatas]